jgi:hypothetical protein
LPFHGLPTDWPTTSTGARRAAVRRADLGAHRHRQALARADHRRRQPVLLLHRLDRAIEATGDRAQGVAGVDLDPGDDLGVGDGAGGDHGQRGDDEASGHGSSWDRRS